MIIALAGIGTFVVVCLLGYGLITFIRDVLRSEDATKGSYDFNTPKDEE